MSETLKCNNCGSIDFSWDIEGRAFGTIERPENAFAPLPRAEHTNVSERSYTVRCDKCETEYNVGELGSKNKLEASR
jgi:hypothetical protein